MSKNINITTPVGRLVEGSLYKGNTTDAEGKPLVVKSGPNVGQPRVDFYFALAIPKNPGETHWAQTAWGKQIWDLGNTLFPGIAQSPTFAWKIVDGDSQIPNRKGKKPCDREGFPGHWVLRFSSGFAPRIFRQENGGFVQMVEADAVKLGYFVQVNGNIGGNGSAQQPGMFLNHSMVCFSAYGPEIVVGPDAASAGFGAAPLPAGASATPLASSVPLPTAGNVPGATPAPLIPGVPVPGSIASPVASVPASPASVPSAPMNAAPLRVMLPAANGATYEQLIAAGWTDATLVQHGMMQAAAPALPAPPAVAPPLAPVGSAPSVPAAAPTVVAPNPQFLQVPGTPPAAVPPAIPVAPVRQLTPAANGATYEQLIAAGWTDATLVQNGLMLAA